MEDESSRHPLGTDTPFSQASTTTHLEGPTAHLSYVLAERNKRVRNLWADTPEATTARTWLMGSCALSEITIKYHHIGLASYQPRESGHTSTKALCVPVPDKSGPEFAPCLAAGQPGAKRRGQYVMLAIPGIASNAESAQWKRGPTLTMYVTPATGNNLVVCSSVLDAICLAQTFRQSYAGRYTVIASTDPKAYPSDWYSPAYWAPWERVYLALSGNGLDAPVAFDARRDVRLSQLANIAQRPLLWARLPQASDGACYPDWAAYFRGGGSPQTTLEIFEQAQVVTKRLSVVQNLSVIEPPRLDEFVEGEFGDVTHDVAYNYVGGYYYYPFSVLQFSIGPNLQKQITRQIRFLRNDGRILGWSRVPSISGASDVIAADDGTLLSRVPEVSESATWSLDQILAYAQAARTRAYSGRRLADILRDMQKLFEQCIWLPYHEQLFLLLFTVPVTYVQELFSAVPYILVQGPKSSGKSELAHLLSWVSSNSTIIGSGSHAFTAAQVDQARGLIVLDDRETLAAEDLDTDLLGLLKVGYKRATGVRGIIGQNRKIIRQHVYGVKAITCVSGVEEIVGARMLRIRTAPYSKARASSPIRRFQAADQEIANRLRQEMHGWAFRNVDLIRAEYEKLASSSRWDEITAPLRTFATLSGDDELQSKLNDAINAQGRQETTALSVEDLLNSLMEDLIRRGMTRELSITHVKNELASRLTDPGVQASVLLNATPVQESWIARTLVAQAWFKPGATVRRTRVRKKVLLRVWELNPIKVAEILKNQTEPPGNQDALSFCQNCDSCEYNPVCEIKSHFKPGDKQKSRPVS